MSNVTYNITLTDIEVIALSTVTIDNFDWINNAAKNRARIAFEELVQTEIKRRFDVGEPIPATREEMILDAYQRGIIVALKDRPNTTL